MHSYSQSPDAAVFRRTPPLTCTSSCDAALVRLLTSCARLDTVTLYAPPAVTLVRAAARAPIPLSDTHLVLSDLVCSIDTRALHSLPPILLAITVTLIAPVVGELPRISPDTTTSATLRLRL